MLRCCHIRAMGRLVVLEMAGRSAERQNRLDIEQRTKKRMAEFVAVALEMCRLL
jgi:hypothetical protein